MSDPIKHECGIAHIRLRKPLQFYIDKYNTPLYGANKLLLLMKKMQNRGQDGAGIANIKLGLEPGYRYISRYRSIDPSPLNKIFDKVGKKFAKAEKEGTPEQFSRARCSPPRSPISRAYSSTFLCTRTSLISDALRLMMSVRMIMAMPKSNFLRKKSSTGATADFKRLKAKVRHSAPPARQRHRRRLVIPAYVERRVPAVCILVMSRVQQQ